MNMIFLIGYLRVLSFNLLQFFSNYHKCKANHKIIVDILHKRLNVYKFHTYYVYNCRLGYVPNILNLFNPIN